MGPKVILSNVTGLHLRDLWEAKREKSGMLFSDFQSVFVILQV